MNDNEQRDELAQVIAYEADKHHGFADGNLPPAQQDRELATAILAAGYRRPEPVDPAEVSIVNGWLVQQANECTCGGGGQECGYHHESGCGYEPLINITEPLKQAGYTLDLKPRTITTVEELDALPVESVVLSDMGNVYIKDHDLDNPTDTWWIAGGVVSEYQSNRILLPATVIHEPTTEATQ